MSSNCCPRCITKPSGSEYSASEEDGLRSKIKTLEDSIKDLTDSQIRLSEKYYSLSETHATVNLENLQLRSSLKECQATNDALLKYLNSLGDFTSKYKNQFNKENRKIDDKKSKISLDKSSFVKRSFGDSSDYQSNHPSKESDVDVIPTFAR